MAKTTLQWHTEQRKVSDLIKWDKNPRKMSDKERADLHQSFARFNYVEVVIINLDNRIIGGHQRIQEMEASGKSADTIDVRVPNRQLNEKEFEELAVRLNKNHGQWDDDLLKEFFDSDDLKDWGFDDQELNNIFDVVELVEDAFNLEDELSKIDKPETVTGDMYLLGDHKLLCGDSINPDDIKRMAGPGLASVIYCDPPYNIGLSYHKGIKGNSNKKTYTNTVFNDNMKDAEYLEWVKQTIQSARTLSKKDAHVFYWCDPKFIGLIQQAFRQTGVKNKSVCFWIKNQFNPVIQMAFNRVTEPCIYGTIGKPRLNTRITNLCEILNTDVSGKQIHESVADIFGGIIDTWLAHRDKTTEYVHPTQKPITLHEKPLKRCSTPGDTIVDLFGGSGSTLISCEQLGRKAVLIEQDPVFCDVIVRRWEKFTGKKAIKVPVKFQLNGKSNKANNSGKKSTTEKITA